MNPAPQINNSQSKLRSTPSSTAFPRPTNLIRLKPSESKQLDVTAILSTLKPIVDPDIYEDVERILTVGSSALFNARGASEANFQAYLKYGNHKSVTQNESVFASTIIKQSKHGQLTLIIDPQLIHFVLNAHLTLQILVDIMHHRRKPRPISDSNFRPLPNSFAINDWTNKKNDTSFF